MSLFVLRHTSEDFTYKLIVFHATRVRVTFYRYLLTSNLISRHPIIHVYDHKLHRYISSYLYLFCSKKLTLHCSLFFFLLKRNKMKKKRAKLLFQPRTLHRGRFVYSNTRMIYVNFAHMLKEVINYDGVLPVTRPIADRATFSLFNSGYFLSTKRVNFSFFFFFNSSDPLENSCLN